MRMEVFRDEHWEDQMSGYIMDLRKTVGHRPLLQVGASVIVENDRGEILLQKRTDNGLWGYAGGSVELDEAVEEAAARELYEETGLKAESLELLGVFSGPEMHYVYPNGDEVSNVDVVFVCRAYSGELRCQKGEVEELQFFAEEALPDEIFDPNRRALAKWAKERKTR